ncbi:hypothetical protein SAMN04489724_3997 [Algoriphagus locisalis]|uniref:Uncharacterized protein n=1 Tax=Algoriphagus locisalis TaxID=305507 RepID=A0A1I7DFB2_9BACT|nr:hypothetical protein [Algoriphagus locisalis]SFU10380.1 hypothetical protein SAMN04489724_3997 [Algoriphagus locisalis]
MVKTVKIWLVLLPVILIIGVVLYIQSHNNQQELENQLTRSVEASKNDIVRALSDYYTRVEAYFVRAGAANAATFRPAARTRIEAQKVAQIINWEFKYSNPRLLPASADFDNSLSFKNGEIIKNGLEIHIDNLQSDYDLEEFRKAFDISESQKNEAPSNLIVDLEIPISELLRKQATNKIFEHFFITFNDGTILYPPSEAGIKLFMPNDIEIDSLGVINSGTSMIQLNYSRNPSRAYVSPIPMEGQQLYAVGLISEDSFQKVGMRLDFGKLSILILFLLILIALIPILGVMNLSPGDNLTQNKVTQVGISLVSLTIIIGFSLSQFKNEVDPVAEQSSLVDELESSLRDTLTVYRTALESIKDFKQLQKEPANFNEIIAFKPTGYVDKIFFKNSPTSVNLIDFSMDTSAIDLSQREYFTFFQASGTDTLTFLNSHYSRSDGQLESVISRDFGNSGEESAIKGINAITFKYKVNQELSEQYRFIAMKENGKILLKSNKISSPIAEIQEGINAEKWGEIKSLMKNNFSSDAQISTSLYLNGNFYTGVLKKVKTDDFDENIWLLFLVNENISHSFASISSAESITLLAIYFLSLLISLLIQKYSRRSFDKQGTKAFLYSWLEPNAVNLPRLNYLILAYTCYAFVLLGIYYAVAISHTDMLLLLVYSSFLISFVNLSTSINSMTFDDFTEFKVQRYSMRSIILFGINVVLLLFITFWNSEIIVPTLILTLVGYGIVGLWFLVVKPKTTFKKQTKSITIPSFIALWFLIIGFLPGYFIQSKTQIYEQVIWNASNQPPTSDSQEAKTDSESFYTEYEFTRRTMLSLIADPFDQKIENFIAPNQQVFKMAMEKGDINLPSFSGILYNVLVLLTMILLFILFANIIQNIIFYPFFSLKRKGIDFSKPKLFICCPQSGVSAETLQKKLKVARIQTINLLDVSLDKADPVSEEISHVHIQNIHCLKNQLEIVPLLNKLIDQKKSIIISSGKSWDELFSRLKEIDDQVIYSETFTEFEFHMLPINLQRFKAEPNEKKHALLHKAENEEKMQLRIAQFADIWSELNFQEKLVCYSFSNERFLNKSRKNAIHELIRKGILIKATYGDEAEKLQEDEGEKFLEEDTTHSSLEWQRYEFFSRLFQTYILTHISKEEIKSFQDFESKNGNSRMIQVSAVSFVLICFALISIFDRTFLNEIYAYLTGTLGLLGSLYALLNRGISSFKFGKGEAPA